MKPLLSLSELHVELAEHCPAVPDAEAPPQLGSALSLEELILDAGEGTPPRLVIRGGKPLAQGQWSGCVRRLAERHLPVLPYQHNIHHRT